ncbi:MAG TPA: Ni/Fe-hydrogenase, b-type cytochrome subunit [Syntrophomonadaceae bacterium]|nr:Ni/Fe-hydrogenase, b-type cytochrome subunit [Syntrophomonadaceae bacterium]
MQELRKAIYVWELPIRLYHWINVFLIIVLLFTGLYIGKPILASVGEPYANFLMGKMRLWHAVAAWLFIANFLFRIYWAYAGNEHAKFKPWRTGFFSDGMESLKYYLFLKKEHTVHAGHNVIAQLTYFFMMWVGSFFMIITGLALQGEIGPGGFQEKFMSWLIPLFGQSSWVRTYHHLVAWLFIVFIIAHLYLTFRQDILDDDGTVSSIFSGYKFVSPDFDEHHDRH